MIISVRKMSLLSGLLLLCGTMSQAQATGILSSEEAMSAAPEVLMTEVGVFKSIRQSMALSVARCETSGVCEATATSDEVQKVIDALDARVEGLSTRQQEAGNSAGLEDVIVAYAEERGGLTRMLKKVGDLTSAVVENIDESELFGDDSGTEAVDSGEGTVDQLSDVFSDEDEDL